MQNHFKGWQSVFRFTFRQATKGTGFKVVTAFVTIAIISIFFLINIMVAKPEKEKQVQISPIESVYVLDNSNLQPTKFDEILPAIAGEQFNNTNFITITAGSRSEVMDAAASNSNRAISVIITATESGYELEAIIPSNSGITKNQAEDLLTSMTSAFESNKLLHAGLSADQLTTIMKPVVTSFSSIGDDQNEIAMVIKIIAPMLFGLMLYMMLLLHGQTISKSVSTEKTSKLMETLLISVHPYALISGKVLAITTMAIAQFVTWVISAVVGLYGGNAIARMIYPGYENSAITIINFLKDNMGETAFTLPAVILAILFFCVGFLFYCVLAGLTGCMVAKPEDVASTQGLFQFPVVISFLICYLAPLMGKDGVIAVSRFIPFTSPFIVPVDLITGTIGLGKGILLMVLLLAFALATIILSARIYKGLILYNGQKISLKTLGKIMKANQ